MSSVLADQFEEFATDELNDRTPSFTAGATRGIGKMPPRVFISGDPSKVEIVDLDETGAGSLLARVDETLFSDLVNVRERSPLSYYSNFGPRRVLVYERHLPQGLIVDVEPAQSAVAAPLAQIVDELRDRIDMPVQDIARMCGVQRRQFYNLLDGSTKNPQEESHIRLLHHVIGEFFATLNSDPKRVRAAILTPLESLNYESFFGAATKLNSGLLRDAFEKLVSYLAAGGTLQSRAVPSGTPSSDTDWTQARDHLRDYPPAIPE